MVERCSAHVSRNVSISSWHDKAAYIEVKTEKNILELVWNFNATAIFIWPFTKRIFDHCKTLWWSRHFLIKKHKFRSSQKPFLAIVSEAHVQIYVDVLENLSSPNPSTLNCISWTNGIIGYKQLTEWIFISFHFIRRNEKCIRFEYIVFQSNVDIKFRSEKHAERQRCLPYRYVECTESIAFY